MSPERWRIIERLFHEASALDPKERAAYFDRECADDPSLKTEVESLLAAHEQTGTFIDEPVVAVTEDLIAQEEPAKARVGNSLGPYEILGVLGVGGMGEVYRARDTRLPREVAIKILRGFVSKDAQRLKRFKREAWAISALNHPNILTVHEFGEANGEHYLATELVDGLTLREYVKQTDPGLPELLELVIQAGSAIAAAHEGGITHRDIKPGNIMVRKDGYVKVLDFGLAKLAHNDSESDGLFSGQASFGTEAGVVLGTVTYMSPEQARGQAVDHRTDLWSLGVLLYEMVTGRIPFDGETPSDVIASILKTEPPPLDGYLAEPPAELQRIVKKALRKNRDERYQLVKEMVLDLKNLRRELEIEGRPGHPIPEARKTGDKLLGSTSEIKREPNTSSASYMVSKIRRHKKTALISLLVLVVTAGTLGYLAFVGPRQSITRVNEGQSEARAIDSIAVLPFINASADPNVDYLSDGIAESLIGSLSQLPGMKVIALSSAVRYRGREVDPQMVAREMGVRAVLTGKVIQRAGTLIVSAELVDALDNRHVWGAQYNQKLTDLLGMQEDIARQMSEKLRLKLTDAEQMIVTKRHTANPEAYQLYLKGRYYWNKRTAGAIRRAIDYFQQAVALDAAYALAYAGIADCYVVAFGYEFLPSGEAAAQAEAAAQQALQLDETLAEAHASLAFIKSFYRGDFSGAGQEFSKALDLNPNYATAHQWHGLYLAAMGRSERALIEIKRALDLDPVSLIINSDAVLVFYYTREYDQATKQCRKVLEMDPSFSIIHTYQGLIFEQNGMYDEAIAEWSSQLRSAPANTSTIACLGHAYAMAGRKHEAGRMLEQLKRVFRSGGLSADGIALIFAGLGQGDEALTWLEAAYQKGTDRLPLNIFFNVDPRFESLHSDPRFVDLARRAGFTP